MENLFILPEKKGVKKQPLDKLLLEDLGLPVSNNSNYRSRVCVKCALKTQNAIELIHFLKRNVNSIVADIEETSNDSKTQ